MTNLPPPPRAEQRAHSFDRHGHSIDDSWAWLRDPNYPQVEDAQILSYLNDENAFFDAAMKPHAALIDTLFAEMKARMKEDDASVPLRDGGYVHWWAFEPGAQYRRWYRRPIAGGPEQCVLDEVALADGSDFFRLGAMAVSPDETILAYSTDVSGSERYTIRFSDLAAGDTLPDQIAGASAPWGEDSVEGSIGQIVFSADGKHLFYGLVDEHWRCRTIKRHRLGSASTEDVVVYDEPDMGFSAGVARSQDRSLILISTGNNTSNETYYIRADDPTAAPVLISPRQENREYTVDAAHGRLWILTNDEHINFRLAVADFAQPAHWTTVIAGSDRVYLRGHSAHRDHLAISARVDGLDQLLLRTYDGVETRIPFAEASYSTGFSGNPEFAPAAYRLHYTSMVTPLTIFDYHPAEQQLETLKVQEIPSGYDPSRYATERLMVPARDGKQVPVSIVYPSGFPRDGSGKLFLYAYGAYGLSVPPGFSAARISLLDRGWAFAIAHVRGGDDLGYGWFLDGKLTKRTNTFNDFVDCAQGLIKAGFSRRGNIAIQGGSAGGELMGAVANSNPDLWGAVVADVPFVDVLNTMLDDTLPLTPGEWPEWGNPIEDQAAFDLIRSYSPYDNVAAQDYPPMLITGGLHDPRVTYWEPAKWAARLRATKTDSNLLLLKINMGAGHGGKSGRWDHLKEVAEAYAFVLTQVA